MKRLIQNERKAAIAWLSSDDMPMSGIMAAADRLEELDKALGELKDEIV